MSEFLALLFVSFSVNEVPNYKFGHCYKAIDAEYRPSIVGIHGTQGKYYKYRIWYGYDSGWSSDLTGKIYTIEFVYNKEIKCP